MTASIHSVSVSKVQPPSLLMNSVLIGAQLAVGSAAIFARFALHGTSPIVVSALRMTIAAAPLFVYSYLRNKKLPISFKHEMLFAFSGIALAIHFSSWIGSLLYTSVAVSTLLVSTTPVWTALFDVLILKHRKNKKFWLAFIAGFCGVVLIATAKSSVVPVVGQALLGDFLSLIGGLGLAIYLIVIRSVSSLYPTVVIVSRTYSWSALALFITAALLQQPMPGNNPISWGGILAMAIVSQLLGHTGINLSLRWFSSSTVAFSTLLEPIFAAILAALIFAENLSVQTVLGAVIVLISLIFILRSNSNKQIT